MQLKVSHVSAIEMADQLKRQYYFVSFDLSACVFQNALRPFRDLHGTLLDRR